MSENGRCRRGRRVLSICSLRMGWRMEGSGEVWVPVAGCGWVGVLLLYKHRLFLLMEISVVLPLSLASSGPQVRLCPLGSPKRRKGVGSWLAVSSGSFSAIFDLGGMYIEQMLIVRCGVKLTATACVFVFGYV